MSKTKKLSHEEFVIAWQASATLAEAAERAGVTRRIASMRAFNLRKSGVPLKTFQQVGTRIDVERLTEIAKRTKTKG